ncbi:MAG: cob(I)yrinic acid a,c-diamide adenosyltransferase [Candidatus Omnitrophica bacterium]|nr:cob(I)yrinic acid a,c-diamide adenosyltransferase [Candidatus Omnitrophota bacterium]
MRGLVHIYTGNGKGKTTAAFGLAVRASGAGLRVSIQQFIKGRFYNESRAVSAIPNITVKQCGNGCFIKGRPKSKDIDCAKHGLSASLRDLLSGRFDVVILDEVNVAMDLGLLKTRDVIKFLKDKPYGVEVILTGRGCPKALYRYADYVSEVRDVKHPYRRGVKARKGIEC